MAWSRRSASSTKVVKKRTSRKTPKKTSAMKQLAVLKRQVKKLNQVSYDKIQGVQTVAQNFNMSSNYNIFKLSAGLTGAMTSLWGDQFPTDATKAYLNKYDIKVSVRQATEPNLVAYSMFLVSLKDNGADQGTFNQTNGNLTISPTTHYAYDGTFSDQVRLSPKYFNIHAVRRFTMGYNGSAGPTADTQSERRFSFTIVPRERLIVNPKGPIFTTSGTLFDMPKNPSQNYYLIVFNNNSSVDLEYNQIDISTIRHWAVAN